MMQKRAANTAIVCPVCGSAKGWRSKTCHKCRYGINGERGRSEQIVTGIAQSQTFKEIALNLKLSVKTVEYHWAMAKAKFGLTCYQDAVYYALRHGWVEFPI